MNRSELAKELHKAAGVLTNWNALGFYAELCGKAAAALEEEDKDARRWRALDTLLERYPDKRPSWDIRHAIRVLVKLDKRELLDIGAVCPSAALDAWIKDHPDDEK